MEKPSENSTVLTLAAMVASTTMIAQHIAGKAARDALFLTYFAVERLPLMMMVSAAISVVAVIAMSRLLTRFGPARLIPLLFLVSAGLLLFQWQVIDYQPKLAAAALYLQIAAINSLLISGFWSVINERFDPYSAKKVIARLAAGATFGGLAGGLLTKLVATMANTHAVLLMLAIMHIVCAFAVFVLSRGDAQGTATDAPVENMLAPLRRSTLIRRMALLALLVATTAALLDYVLKAEAAESLSPDQLITFFSYFYVVVGLFSFALQSTVGNKVLRWFGLGGTLLVWPIVVITTSMGVLLMRSLVAAAMMRASANVFYNSFFRTGFEVMYTPIPAAEKRTGKVMIDVGADRSGDILGGLIVMGILALPAFGEDLLLITAIILAAACILIILLIHRGYVSQLATNLDIGRASADEPGSMASQHSRSQHGNRTVIDREELLREIASRHAGRERDTPPAGPTFQGGSADSVIDSILALRSGDETRIRHVLMSRTITHELMPHVIALLDNDAILADVLPVLRRASSDATGQLTDSLLDPFQPEHIRRRIPLVLAYSDNPLAIPGLLRAFHDPSWNVRFRAARGLEIIKRRNPLAMIPEENLVEAAMRELQQASAAHMSHGVQYPPRVTLPQRLQLLFYLIGAMDDPHTTELCHSAINSDDMRLRGTAFEYLENRLPEALWQGLHSLLDAGPLSASGTQRSSTDAARELQAAADKLRVSRKDPAL